MSGTPFNVYQEARFVEGNEIKTEGKIRQHGDETHEQCQSEPDGGQQLGDPLRPQSGRQLLFHAVGGTTRVQDNPNHDSCVNHEHNEVTSKGDRGQATNSPSDSRPLSGGLIGLGPSGDVTHRSGDYQATNSASDSRPLSGGLIGLGPPGDAVHRNSDYQATNSASDSRPLSGTCRTSSTVLAEGGGTEGRDNNFDDAASFKSLSDDDGDHEYIDAEESFLSIEEVNKCHPSNDTNPDDGEGLDIAKEALYNKCFRHEDLLRVLQAQKMPAARGKRNSVHDDNVGRHVFGYYAYGSSHGVCRRTKDQNSLVRYINGFFNYHLNGGEQDERSTWTSISILHNSGSSLHVDKNNLVGSRNYITGCGDFSRGGLWIEEDRGEEWISTPEGARLQGRCFSINGEILEFDPKRRHKGLAWEGDRWTVTLFTSRAITWASKSSRALLRNLGFQPPTGPEIRGMKEQAER